MAFTRQFIAGAYNVVYTAADESDYDLGYTEAGFDLLIDVASPVPVRTDRRGSAQIDGAWQNIDNVMVRIETLYWNADVWGAAFEQIIEDITDGTEIITAGTLLSQNEKVGTLVLTPKTGSAAISEKGGHTWTFTKAFPVEPINLRFSAKEVRRVPVGFQIFPTLADDNSEAQWWTAVSV
jgi:hypothetical protein